MMFRNFQPIYSTIFLKVAIMMMMMPRLMQPLCERQFLVAMFCMKISLSDYFIVTC